MARSLPAVTTRPPNSPSPEGMLRPAEAWHKRVQSGRDQPASSSAHGPAKGCFSHTGSGIPVSLRAAVPRR
jgi:hypothetical protein